jgi:hypothetical protein
VVDEGVYEMAQEPRTAGLLRAFWKAKDEDRPALAKRLLEVQPGLVVALLAAAIPHLLPQGEDSWQTAATFA